MARSLRSRSAAAVPRVVVNARGSQSGGARTYLICLLDELARTGPRGVRWQFLLPAGMAGSVRGADGVEVECRPDPHPALRVLWEQGVLPWRHALQPPDVLVNIANFCPLARRTRSIVFARNALYFGEGDESWQRSRRMRVETRLGVASVRRAAVTVTASDAMAARVRAKTSRPVVVNRFGPGLAGAWEPTDGEPLVLLHRTGWGPHKSFADLLRAIREAASTHPGRFVLHSACDPTTEFARAWPESVQERELLEDPLVRDHVDIRSFPPTLGATLVGDVVVMPSAIESFCFPLAEAVGLKMPVIAADSDFARELCGEDAQYYDSGDWRALADAIRRVVDDPALRRPTGARSLTWGAHADGLAELCRTLGRGELPSNGAGTCAA